MVKIQIDGNEYGADPRLNLLENCIALGFDVPYFCYHPAMGSVGACRQCAVKKYANAEDTRGKIIMSCMEPVTEGLIISINDPEAKEFRAGVIEGLMTNHPHDCPVCDEGGECHLQDMTVMTGHDYRRFRFKKRTHTNQYLGPFINHEMNRCIQCYRCVRFYRDYAGGKDLNVFSAANKVYFGREKDGLLESEFSGNLVEVCPTGVFTDKTLKKHFTRKWDLSNAPSVCVHCSLGCNTLVSERYGIVRRIMSRYNGDVNGYFLCDRGRFGYEYIHQPSRIKNVLVKHDGIQSISSGELSMFSNGKVTGSILGIGSPRASLESNYALMRLSGKENFYHGIPASEHKLVKKALDIMDNNHFSVPTLKEAEQCDTIFILGDDVTQTAPVLALAIRQAVRNKPLKTAAEMGIPKWNDSAAREIAQQYRSPLYIANPFSTKLDDIAAFTFNAIPSDIARLGFAVAHAIQDDAPDVSTEQKTVELASRIATDLLAAEKPLLIAGTTEGNEDNINALINISIALSKAGKRPFITFTFSECNSAGLGMMDGGNLDDALEHIRRNTPDTIVILENDLYRKVPESILDTLFMNSKVIAIDHLENATTRKADVVLPAGTVAESSGTMVNNEGRAQRFYPALPPDNSVKDSWRWICDLSATINHEDLIWHRFDDAVNSLTHYYPRLTGIRNHLPNAAIRYYNEKIARQTLRFSGRTAIHANLNVSEPGPPDDSDTPLSFSMEGFKGIPPADLTAYYWSPGWNSPQAINKYLDEPAGSAKENDPGIRLLGDKTGVLPGYSREIPEIYTPTEDFLIIRVSRIFGSDELSSQAPAVKELIPAPYVLVNHKEAEKFLSSDKHLLKMGRDGFSIAVEIRTDNQMPDGVAGLSWLLPGMPYCKLPAKGKIENATA